MKVAVINFSGNVGKTTISRHLLLPRIAGAELICVESLNADGNQGQYLRGRQFAELFGIETCAKACFGQLSQRHLVQNFLVVGHQFRHPRQGFLTTRIKAPQQGEHFLPNSIARKIQRIIGTVRTKR